MKLYRKDSEGEIRFLEITTNGAYLIQTSGIVGTAKPMPYQKACSPKNVGKKNETTAETQAVLQAEALYKKKLKDGYFENMAHAINKIVIMPMLAKDYKKEVKKINWSKPVYAQPKLDGMRALGDNELISRENSVIETLPHIVEEIRKISLHLDGELYAHGLTFQENMRLIKKYRKGETEQIKYHVYDCVLDKPFHERYKILSAAVKDAKNIELVPTILVKNEAELKKVHAQFVADGYEGTIVRHGDEPYKSNARSSNLLKYKDFLDISLEIIDIIPCTQRPTWGKPVFHWPGAKNDRLEAGMKFSHAYRETFLACKDMYIGKIAELRFFQYSENGVPWFPVMHGYRLEKSKSDVIKNKKIR